MKLYNSLTKQIDEFKSITPGVINMYVCGPTVYNYPHIGNMRPVIFFDTVYRYFRYKGYDVRYASNFTDVDDKIIQAALSLGITERALADKFIKAYLEDLNNYHCLDVTYRPRVTDVMDDIIKFIQVLVDKGYAYLKDKNVYFRVSKIDNYGELSNQDTDNLKAGLRVESSDDKESPYDFVLWKNTDVGIKWDSPFGPGRPGWHTECVVMINNIFKNKIDIHGGGIDLKFPHHENEIAQSKAHSDHNLANYWMHNGHITVNGEKMSKSLNNFILARDLIKKYSANSIRLAILKTHYRQPLNLTVDLLIDSDKIDEKIFNVLKLANSYMAVNNLKPSKEVKLEPFCDYMDDDFNTPNAITYILDVVKNLNVALRNSDNNDIIILFTSLMTMSNILGLCYDLVEINDEDKQLFKKWLTLRDNKEYELADQLRKILNLKQII